MRRFLTFAVAAILATVAGVGLPMSAHAGITADLSMVKTHTGVFTVGTNGTFTLSVHNNSVGSVPATTGTQLTNTVTDPLPTGLTYVSATGTSWNCGASGQTVTCTTQQAINGGSSTTPITLVVAVGAAAVPTVTNTATEQLTECTGCDPNPANDTATDPVAVVLAATAPPTAAPTPTPTAAAVPVPVTGAADRPDSSLLWITAGLLAIGVGGATSAAAIRARRRDRQS